MSDFQASDIIKSISVSRRSKELKNQRLLAKILRSFLDKAQDEILDGNTVLLPGKAGRLLIVKRIQQDSAPISLRGGTATKVFDPRTMGYQYGIKVQSEYLNHCGIEFKAGSSLRGRLHKKLIGGFSNYKML